MDAMLRRTSIHYCAIAVAIVMVMAKTDAFSANRHMMCVRSNRSIRSAIPDANACRRCRRRRHRHRHQQCKGVIPDALRVTPDGADDGDDDDRDDDDDDEEEDRIEPYGNRSLAWTKRYRKLNPYDKVRRRVLRFGHRSKADWDECVASGHQGQYVPARPDEMYAPEWVSWEEFLGLMRPFEETRNLAVNVLGLSSFDEYVLFVRQNPKRAEGLRIPLRPDIFYKDDWVNEEHFFSKT